IVTPADYQQRVESYTTYNTTVTYRGIKNMVITGGIKNLLNEDPPFTLERFPFELNRKDSQIRCDVIHHGG
ncbi:MAG: hypothetical protein ACK5XI_09685, partial [Hyphomonadaceae bacterium]